MKQGTEFPNAVDPIAGILAEELLHIDGRLLLTGKNTGTVVRTIYDSLWGDPSLTGDDRVHVCRDTSAEGTRVGVDLGIVPDHSGYQTVRLSGEAGAARPCEDPHLRKALVAAIVREDTARVLGSRPRADS